MKLKDLLYEYPECLVATEPQHPSRVMWVDESPEEISFAELMRRIPSGDLLVVNNTRVLKRRVFAGTVEILFIKTVACQEWLVLFPSKKMKIGEVLELPAGIQMQLLEKGLPQRVRLSMELEPDYFEKWGEVPLPPYIQKARAQRHTLEQDPLWYQSAWAQKEGSYAAPTASLHFSKEDLRALKARGVFVVEVTLHVGLGTFLPVHVEDLENYTMHAEEVEVSAESWDKIQEVKASGGKIWALGTTSVRAIESVALGLLEKNSQGGWLGETKLLIQEGYKWNVVDCLLTNFHQPGSTLLALVAGFASLVKVKDCYKWAIDKKFRLFSYGDLSVWRKNETR